MDYPRIATAAMEEALRVVEDEAMDDEAVDDEAVYDEAEEAMWKDTRLQGGGRELSRLGGGILYEVASLREKAKDEEERQQVGAASCISWYDGWAHPGCYETKSSVEGARTTESQAVKQFQCDGTMYRHTNFGWDEAPVTYRRAHVVEASKSRPVNFVMYEHLIEDLLPQERHVYWETVWRKCESCHSRDLQFEAWIASSPRAATRSEARGDRFRAAASSSAS